LLRGKQNTFGESNTYYRFRHTEIYEKRKGRIEKTTCPVPKGGIWDTRAHTQNKPSEKLGKGVNGNITIKGGVPGKERQPHSARTKNLERAQLRYPNKEKIN